VKTFLKAVALVLAAAAVPALAVVMPMRIPFQGKLVDPATNNPKNGAFSMVFKLYDAPTGGNTLFTETQTVTVVNGQFTAQIGTITYLNADVLAGTSAYLGITVGADAEMAPRQPLSMSPYAYTAVQLASDKSIRINSGTTYSTFTALGNLTLPYGVVGGTATFATVNSTGVGTFSITTSSGISMGDGSLKISASADGIDAQGTGIIASTGTFMTLTSTGVGTFGIVTSSGIDMGGGTLLLEADSRGISAIGTGIVASTGVFLSSVTAQQFFGIGVSTIVFKPADTNIISNTVLTSDADLAIQMGANQTYSVYGVLFASSTVATNDIKIALSVPAGATLNVGYYANGGSTLTFTSGMLRVSGVQNNPLIQVGASIMNPIFLNGTVVNGGTAGAIQLQWAQFTSVATNMTVTAGSYLGATRIK
jgi:hypothetical protein